MIETTTDIKQQNQNVAMKDAMIVPKYDKFLSSAVLLLSSFAKHKQLPDAHVEEFFTCPQGLQLTKEAQHLTAVVFHDCLAYENVFKVVLDGYLATGSNMLKSDRQLYRVLCCITMFHFDDIGLKGMKSLVPAHVKPKASKFMEFFLNPDNLDAWIKHEWCKLYEESHVEKRFLAPIRRNSAVLQKLLEHLSGRIPDVTDNHTPVVKRVTETKPFNLTKPKARNVPVPRPISRLGKPVPVPKSLYRQPALNEKLEQIRRENQETAVRNLSMRYNPVVSRKTERAIKRLNDIIVEDENKYKAKPIKPKPLVVLSNSEPVKLTRAVIIRDKKRCEEKQEDQLKRISDMIAGGLDSSLIVEQELRIKEAEMKDRKKKVQQQYMAGKLGHEETRIATEKRKEENKKIAAEVKVHKEAMMREYVDRKLDEDGRMRELVEETLATRDNAISAKQQLVEYKRKLVQDINKESRELMRQALEEAESELRKKAEIVKQIRELESIPAARPKLFDPTETSGARLLCEMSIIELKERLVILKEKQLRAEEERREAILEHKQTESQKMLDALEVISKDREWTTMQRTLKTENLRRRNERIQKEVNEDPSIRALKTELEEKRRARQQREQEEKDAADGRRKATLDKSKIYTKLKRQQTSATWRELERVNEAHAMRQNNVGCMTI